MGRIKRVVRPIGQRSAFALERFEAHELANHAAAGAYAFLLSAMPAILLALGLASALLRARPLALAEAQRTVAAFIGVMEATDAIKAFFSRPLGGAAALIGALSLLYSARLLAVTIQRGLRVVWGRTVKIGILHANLLGFLLELLVLLAVLATLVASEAARLLALAPGWARGALWGGVMEGAVRAAAGLAPPAVLFAFVVLSYRLVPSPRPALGRAFAGALFCVLATLAFSSIFGLFMGESRYNLLYGIFGNLIVLLANVYFFFCFFFFFAELVFIEEHFDALLLARYQRSLSAPHRPGHASFLFGEPDRLIRRYARLFAKGEKIFTAGEGGTEAFFVQQGRVGIYRPTSGGEVRLASIEEGEIFGEMALMQGEARSATARADEECRVLAIPQEIFELYLLSDDEAPRRLADLLAARLRGANDRAGSEAPTQGLDP